MLPEHVKLLREWSKEDEEVCQPMLDEQELEQLNAVLLCALEEGEKLVLTYYEGNRYKILIGTVKAFQEWNHRLKVIDEFGLVHFLAIEQIVDARFDEG